MMLYVYLALALIPIVGITAVVAYERGKKRGRWEILDDQNNTDYLDGSVGAIVRDIKAKNIIHVTCHPDAVLVYYNWPDAVAPSYELKGFYGHRLLRTLIRHNSSLRAYITWPTGKQVLTLTYNEPDH